MAKIDAPEHVSEAAPRQWAPRFALGWASLVYASAVMTLAYPALAGGFLVNPHSDQYIAGFAFREFAAQFTRSTGGFPQFIPDANRAAVGPEDHVRVQDLEQRLEVALARGREEGVDDLALGVEVGVGDRSLALDVAAGTARELARRLG